MSARAAPAPAPTAPGARRGETTAGFRLMADHAPVMIWFADGGPGYTYINRLRLEFTGRPLDAELGFGWTEALHPDDQSRILETYARAFESREPFEAEYRLRRHDGAWCHLLDKGVPLVSDGELVGFAGSCADITDHVAAFALVSHELRSPLNAIKSWTHVLEHHLRDVQPPVRRALEGIMTGVDHQVRIIDDLLDARARMLRRDTDALHWQKGLSMSDRKTATPVKADSDKRRAEEIEAEKRRTAGKERPERGPDPDTLEGPGDRQDAKEESDARNKVTRRGER